MTAERNLRFYMANLGSEVSRYLSCLEKGQNEFAGKCLVRADGIVKKMMELPESQPRMYELKIISDVLKDFQNVSGKYKVGRENLKNYFKPFTQRILS